MYEYEIKQESPIEIYFSESEIFKSASLKNLLPLMFDKTSYKTQKLAFNFSS
jgi:cytidine deaminase